VVVIFVVVVVVSEENAAADADAVFLIEIEIDQGVEGVIFVIAANVTTIDSMAMIDDDDD